MWEDDGSNCVKGEGADFRVEGEGSPVNALFNQELQSGQYFEVDVRATVGNAGVGVTTRAGFGKGWGCKGLFFNGNLSNGSALVRGQFGKQITAGQKIGVLTEFDADTVTVTFYQDGQCLGPAFTAKRKSDGAIFPCVHAKGSGDAFAIRFAESPAARARQPEAHSHPAGGVWTLVECKAGPELAVVPVPEKVRGGKVSMSVDTANPKKIGLSVTVANHLNTFAMPEEDPAAAPFEKVKTTMVMSTRMMGPPDVMELERAICLGLEKVDKWHPQPDSLVLQGPEIEMRFERGVEGPDDCPATEELP